MKGLDLQIGNHGEIEMKDVRKASRKQKILAADRFRMLSKLGNGRKRAADDLLDSWMATLRDIMRRY